LSSIKKLAGETLWYGGSTIAAKFINYLLTPFLTYTLAHESDYGKIGVIYAWMPIFNVLFTYGFETAYFRFSSNKDANKNIYSTASLSLIGTTFFFTLLLWLNQILLGKVVGMAEFPTIIQLMILIIAVDTLSAIPFARLRQENKPRKFAAAKILGILVNIFLTWFFIGYCPKHVSADNWISLIYDPSTNPITYVVFANLIQAIITLLFLTKEILQIRFTFDVKLWKQMMVYAAPLILVGLGGMINETMDRIMLFWWLPGTKDFRETQVGIYNASYKLSILITLFIQAFKMSAEPFFFKQAAGDNPQRTYARVMKFFVMIISIMFLVVSLFIPIWKYFIGPKYWEGLVVVPYLLMANIFLGIYYNLSVWYKLSNKTLYGAWVTLLGAVITIVLNYAFIPKFGFMACAITTCICYGTMMVVSFIWGQKHYRIPYAWKKLVAYLCIVVIIFLLHKGITNLITNQIFSFILATLLLLLYCRFLTLVEHKEFAKLPYVGKYFIQKKTS
jgi:O-antigen/teichoic acid export membrane protein